MIKRRRGIDIFNMSFLDVVSCGFGAIILLLVIVKVAEPFVLEKIHADLSGLVQRLQDQLEELSGEARVVNRDLSARQQQLSDARQKLARLQGELSRVRGEFDATRLDSDAQTVIEQQLELAQQSLSEEQKRLLGASYRRPPADARIGGVPVDSEYIVFIIDTSGSMQKHAWTLVQKKVREVLDIYPLVKGIQVMNDMGDYMFSQYQGRWITDTPARRKSILKRLAGWTPFSNSSPVEGIEAAIRRFYSSDKNQPVCIWRRFFTRLH